MATKADTNQLPLVAHPTTPLPAVRSLVAHAGLDESGGLEAGFVVSADLDQIVWPAARPIIRADELWQTTCFELFVAMPDSERYLEFNFSPSRQWAAYGFEAYRAGMHPLEAVEVKTFDIARDDDSFMLRVRLNAPALQPFAGKAAAIALSAVIEASDNGISYWALAHPSDRPDFHDKKGFTGTLVNRKDT
ncbi:DOMON-like domain-containing protein [Hyphococcus formosus]|uniref:DOMON-like domain-containing protein n=1 Tax=Hyphococcus formosus TaxID=3143534 RepID=UPI00398B855E